MQVRSSHLALGSVIAVVAAAACGAESTPIDTIKLTTGSTDDGSVASSTTGTGGAASATMSAAVTTTGAGPVTMGGVGTPVTAAAVTTTGATGTDGGVTGASTDGAMVTGTDGSTTTDGASTSTGMGGASSTAATDVGTTGDVSTTGPYDPRTGPFKMLVYSITRAFTHDSIPAGQAMLQEIATEQDFEITVAADNSEINAAGLSQYEILFFMNPTGDIFNSAEQQAFEDWMTTEDGAFAGVHSATDTENGWAFYSEVTGQYYNLHDNCCSQANIQWTEAGLQHFTVQGLPNPWTRSEEWYLFNQAGSWSTKAGFTVLSNVTTNNNTRPVSYVREYSSFRSFYTSLGHQSSAFEDELVKEHIARGIMWAVRREAEYQ